MPSKKHYIITSVTLGLIGAASAALIGLANLATRGQIAKNEVEKTNKGIASIYGEGATAKSEDQIDTLNITNKHDLLTYRYIIEKDGVTTGMAFKTSGYNDYGKISLIVGFAETSHDFIGMFVVVNEQTYASTLVEKYINPVNDGSRDIEDTSCGATFGAKKVKEMIDQAKVVADELWAR